jgi:hypothetical protein
MQRCFATRPRGTTWQNSSPLSPSMRKAKRFFAVAPSASECRDRTCEQCALTRRRPQSLRLGTLEFTSAAILAGSVSATEYDCDHSSEPSATVTIFTVRFCAGSSTAP